MWEPMPNDDVFGCTTNSVPIQWVRPPMSRIDVVFACIQADEGLMNLLRRLAD